MEVKEAVADEVVTEKVEEEKPQELETLLKVGSISSGPRNFNILDCLGVRHQAFWALNKSTKYAWAIFYFLAGSMKPR